MGTEAAIRKEAKRRWKDLGSRVFCKAQWEVESVRIQSHAIKSKNVDMSNEKKGEKPNGRKSKGSNKTRDVSWVKRTLIES